MGLFDFLRKNMPGEARCIGEIKFYNETKGYGFVVTDGREYFFHITNCDYKPVGGDMVTYILKETAKGINAFQITKIDV